MRNSPDATLSRKVPAGHDVHVPADAPPQPLRYCPAMHDEAEHAEQEEAPALGVRDWYTVSLLKL